MLGVWSSPRLPVTALHCTAVHRQRALWLAFLAGFSAACVSKDSKLAHIIAPLLLLSHPTPPPPHLTTLFDMHGLFADGSRQGGVREGLQVGEPAALLLGAP